MRPRAASRSGFLSGGDGAVILNVEAGNGRQPEKRSQVTIDRVTGNIVGVEGFAAYNPGRKLRTVATFLHTGEVLGLPGQMVARTLRRSPERAGFRVTLT